MFQDRSAKMCQDNSARMSQDRNAEMSQDSSAKMFQGNNARMSQDKSQGRNARMSPDNSASRFHSKCVTLHSQLMGNKRNSSVKIHLLENIQQSPMLKIETYSLLVNVQTTYYL